MGPVDPLGLESSGHCFDPDAQNSKCTAAETSICSLRLLKPEAFSARAAQAHKQFEVSPQSWH